MGCTVLVYAETSGSIAGVIGAIRCRADPGLASATGTILAPA